MYRYTSNFDSEDGLQIVVDSIKSFNENRFLYSLQIGNRWNIDKVRAFDNQVLRVLSCFNDQYERLYTLSQTFNEQYVTSYNECFNTAHVLLRKIRSGTKGMKNVYKRLTPNSTQRKLPPNYTPSILYSHSPIGTDTYSDSLFSIEEYPKEVQQLYVDIDRFFQTMYAALLLCIDVIREEQRIRNNPKRCEDLYQAMKDEQYLHISDAVNSINIQTLNADVSNNAVFALRKRVKTMDEFYTQGFHAFLPKEMWPYITYEITEESSRGEYTTEELALFKKDEDMINDVRTIIAQFDKYLPEKVKAGKVPAMYIAALQFWSGAKNEKLFVRYFQEQYTKSNGKYKVPTEGAVNSWKINAKPTDSERLGLIEQWDSIKNEKK